MRRSLIFGLMWSVGLPFAMQSAQGGLIDELRAASEQVAGDLCDGVSLVRGLKYGDSEQNIADVASGTQPHTTPRPVLLFVAGESFGNENVEADWSMRMTAICMAARNNMVGVAMSYRRAPDATWPAGTRDVAAAISWMHQNVDLFGGDPRQIIAVGYAAGAFHLANLIAHKEFQSADLGIAGAVLFSGIYRPNATRGDAERLYFGTDPNGLDHSVLPGIAAFEPPIVLAWSSNDPQNAIADAQDLEAHLCKSGHCPRVAQLSSREALSSIFDREGAGKGLAERTDQLISQIEMRGLP